MDMSTYEVKSLIIEKVKHLQRIDGEHDSTTDCIFSILYDLVFDEVHEIVGDNIYLKDFQSLFIKMLNFKYSRLGTESLSAYNYSGVSETFLSDYPEDIKRTLNNLEKSNKRLITL